MNLITISFCFIQCFNGMAQKTNYGQLKNGDILFQDLDCGSLCEAIEEVTKSYRGRSFSHLGLVTIIGDSTFILEAIGNEVQLTPIAIFTNRNKNEILLGRVRKRYEYLLPMVISTSTKKYGIPYDEAFLYDNDKYYCSELIYDVFLEANGNKPFFELCPMTFKQPNTNDFYPVWVNYYSALKLPIPEKELGINPGGISRSKKLKIYKYKSRISD